MEIISRSIFNVPVFIFILLASRDIFNGALRISLYVEEMFSHLIKWPGIKTSFLGGVCSDWVE